MREHIKLLKDSRTLSQTPRQTEVLTLHEEEYFHLGLDNVIKQMLLKSNDEYIHLLINIDGPPLAKASRASLCPILYSNTINNAVYLVGAYFEYNRPEDSNSFLQYLVNNLIHLINNSYRHANKIIKIRLFSLICDALDKSFILCIKGHLHFIVAQNIQLKVIM